MNVEITINADDKRVRPEKSEVERLRCDNKKILAMTGWRPKYNLEAGLRETIEWLKDHLNEYKPDMYNV